MEYRAARRIVGQEQLIKSLEAELAAAHKGAEYLEVSPNGPMNS